MPELVEERLKVIKRLERGIGRVGQLERRLKELEELGLEERLGSLRAELKSSLEGAIKGLKAELGEVGKRLAAVDELSMRIKGLEGRISTLPTMEMLKSYEKRLEALKNAVGRVTQQAALQTERRLKRLRGAMKGFEESLSRLSDELRAEVFSRGETVKELGSSIEELRSRLDGVASSLGEMEKRIGGLEGLRKEVRAELGKALKSISARLKELEAIPASVPELREALKSAEGEIGKVKAGIASLRRALNEISETVKGLEGIEARLRDELDVLVGKGLDRSRRELLDVVEKKVEPLSKRIASVEGAYNKLKEELGRLRPEEVERMSSALASLRTEHAKLAEEVKGFKPEEIELRFASLREELKKGLKGAEKRLKAMPREMGTRLKEISDKIGLVSSELEKLKKLRPEELEEMRAALKEVRDRCKKLAEEIKGLRPDEIEKRFASLREELKKGLKGLEERMKAIPLPVVTEAQIREITDRIILLESRLAALEKSLEEAKIRPIIIE
jgi:chromosome segregation ATPase